VTHGSGASAAAPGVFARYVASALLAAAAVGVTVALGGAVAQTLFVFSFAAVSLAAWFGGTGPAALAAVLCVLGVDYYLLPPVRAFTPTDPGGLVPLAAFLVVAALLATLTASLRAARDASTRAAARLAAQTRDLEAANEQLQEQAVELEAQQAELELTAQQLHEQQAELEIRAESLHEANANLESALADAVRARRDAAAGRAAAAAAEARLRDAFGQAPAGIAVTEGPEHRFVLVNARAEAVVGRRDLVGRTYAEAFPEFAAQGFVALLDRVYATGEPYIAREARVVLPQPEGSAAERFYDFVYQPLRDESGRVTGILQHAVDVSDQVRARAQTERLQALTAALAGARTVDEVAAVVVAEGVAATGAATGMLAVRPAGADDAVIVRQHGLHPDVVARYARFPLTAPGPAAACLRTGEPQWAESRAELLARYPDAAAVWDALGTETVATVPLAVAGPDGTPWWSARCPTAGRPRVRSAPTTAPSSSRSAAGGAGRGAHAPARGRAGRARGGRGAGRVLRGRAHDGARSASRCTTAGCGTRTSTTCSRRATACRPPRTSGARWPRCARTSPRRSSRCSRACSRRARRSWTCR
jgi:PAS domain S-box-containing protein